MRQIDVSTFVNSVLFLFFLDVEIRCLKSGMDDIMAKPMNLRTLQRRLTEHDRRKIKTSSQ